MTQTSSRRGHAGTSLAPFGAYVLLLAVIVAVVAAFASFLMAQSDVASARCRGAGFVDSASPGRGSGPYCLTARGELHPSYHGDDDARLEFDRQLAILGAWAGLRAPAPMAPIAPLPGFPPA